MKSIANNESQCIFRNFFQEPLGLNHSLLPECADTLIHCCVMNLDINLLQFIGNILTSMATYPSSNPEDCGQGWKGDYIRLKFEILNLLLFPKGTHGDIFCIWINHFSGMIIRIKSS